MDHRRTRPCGTPPSDLSRVVMYTYIYLKPHLFVFQVPTRTKFLIAYKYDLITICVTLPTHQLSGLLCFYILVTYYWWIRLMPICFYRNPVCLLLHTPSFAFIALYIYYTPDGLFAIYLHIIESWRIFFFVMPTVLAHFAYVSNRKLLVFDIYTVQAPIHIRSRGPWYSDT